jgi:hypothetical protein
MAVESPGGAFETMVREYRGKREFERAARSRRREGWRVVSVLRRPGQPGALHRAARSLSAGLSRAPTEYLVTYRRTPQPPPAARPLQWLFAPQLATGRATRRWLWIAASLVLVALLAYGLLDFFADAVPF